MATTDRTIHEINSTRETEKILGICHTTLYVLLHEKKIESSTLGRKRIFTRRQIETFILWLEAGDISLDGESQQVSKALVVNPDVLEGFRRGDAS